MVMSNTVGELEYTDEEALNLGASFKEANDEEAIVGGEIELHILDKSSIKLLHLNFNSSFTS